MKKISILFMGLCLLGNLLSAKEFTVKGSLLTGTTMEIQGKTDYEGRTEHKFTENYSANNGLGFGLEYSLLNANKNYGLDFLPERLEILGGFSFSPARSFAEYTGKNKLSAADFSGSTSRTVKYSYEAGELTLRTTSFYLTPRYFFSFAFLPTTDFYAGLKLSYNLFDIGGENVEELKLDNAIGYGFTLGAVVNQEWDVGMAYHIMGGLDQPASGTEVWKISELTFSAGYSFGQSTRPEVWTAPVKKEKPVEKIEEPKPVAEPEPVVVPEPIAAPAPVVEETPVPEQTPVTEPEEDLFDTINAMLESAPVAEPQESVVVEEQPVQQTEQVAVPDAQPVAEPEQTVETITEPVSETPVVVEETLVVEEIPAEELKVETLPQPTPEEPPVVMPVVQPAETQSAPENSASRRADEARQRMQQRLQERRL